MRIEKRIVARIYCPPDYREKLEALFEELGIHISSITYIDGAKFDKKLKKPIRMVVDVSFYDHQFDELKECLEKLENKYCYFHMIINPVSREFL